MAAIVALWGLLAGAVDLELKGCEDLVDRPALAQQLRLEGADDLDAVAQLECHNDGWVLDILTAKRRHRGEPLKLPDLRAPSQLRVLALIVVERARSLTLALPPQRAADLSPPPERALWVIGEGPRSLWRVTVSASTEAGVTAGPVRAGAQLGAQRGPWGLSGGFSIGSSTHPLGKVSALSMTVEPEVTVMCLRWSPWQGCAGARLVAGYGTLSGSQPGTNVTASRVEGPIFGGAGRVGVSLALNGWLALDVDGTLGWLWAPVGTIDGVRSAALGGTHFQARAGLAFAWGSP